MDEGKHPLEYHSSRRRERMHLQAVILFLFDWDCHRIPYNSLQILESVPYFHQLHIYESHSMYVSWMTENRTYLHKGETIQETLREKCPVLPLKLPVWIQAAVLPL